MLAYTLLASVLASTVLAQNRLALAAALSLSLQLVSPAGRLPDRHRHRLPPTPPPAAPSLLPQRGSGTFDGATLNAGSGACGFNMTDRATPLVCARRQTSSSVFILSWISLRRSRCRSTGSLTRPRRTRPPRRSSGRCSPRYRDPHLEASAV
ncbi:hypothetical protein BKA62DRAFT_727453, partial [Auriculariales sp. MPI-PUGE-AT-0066]